MVKHSIGDAEGLINSLMLVAALALSFATTLYTGTFSHEDYLAADARHARWSQASNDIPETSAEFPTYDILSYRFVREGMWCCSLLIASLCIGVMAHVSLSYSSAREEEAEFELWFKYFRFLILLGYIFLIVGLYVFFGLNHTAVDIAYPRYSSVVSTDIYDPVTGQMKEEYYNKKIVHQGTAALIAGCLRVFLPVMFIVVLIAHVRIARTQHPDVSPASAYGCQDLAEAIKWREAGHIDEHEFIQLKTMLLGSES